MVYAGTYIENVSVFRARISQLTSEGKWPQYLLPCMGASLIKVGAARSSDESKTFCLIKLNIRDIIGDPEDPSYVSFCDDVGFDVLAFGSGIYDQIKNDPIALAKYRNVLPDKEILDGEGAGTGVFEFHHWIEFDAPIRN